MQLPGIPADSLSLPLVILLRSNLAHAVLVDEDAGEAAGEHDSEQLDHGQDRAGDGENRQNRDDVVLEIQFTVVQFRVDDQSNNVTYSTGQKCGQRLRDQNGDNHTAFDDVFLPACNPNPTFNVYSMAAMHPWT